MAKAKRHGKGLAESQSAKTLIDGYNLMYAAGIAGAGKGPGGLQRCRLALLNFLAHTLPADEVPRTVIVFDANRPAAGAPRTARHQGLLVYFAARHEDADELIEELISAHSAPRRLTVVSSDHRLQRAARRRRAKAIDSDAWYEQLLRERPQRVAKGRRSKPVTPLPAADVEYWLQEFGEDDANSRRPTADTNMLDELSSPFPPGYGEDVLDEEA